MKIKGYGVELSTSEWAERLGLNASDVSYYVDQKGLTIEELFTLRGSKYKPPRPRKPREGKKMLETKERIGILLEVSGFIDRNDTEGIDVRWVSPGTWHSVHFNGQPLGAYNYKTGVLRLSGGQSIPLWELDWEEAKVVQDEEGLFHPHPNTHIVLVNKALNAETPSDTELTEFFTIQAQSEELRETGRQTYEGFGKRLTAAQWSRTLGVPKNTLGRHLNRGETIESIAQKRGIKL